MAEGESLAANSLSFQVIDFVGFKNRQGSNPAPGSELLLENHYDFPDGRVRIPHGVPIKSVTYFDFIEFFFDTGSA